MYCVQKEKKSCVLHRPESIVFSQWQIHGQVLLKPVKKHVGAYLLAIVIWSFLSLVYLLLVVRIQFSDSQFLGWIDQ